MPLPVGSPQETADHFAHAILTHGALSLAWDIIDEPLRRAFAEMCIEANAAHPLVRPSADDLDALADTLATDGPEHLIWPLFAPAVVDTLREMWAHVDLTTWRWTTYPRPVGVGLEIVLLADVENARDLGADRLECPAIEFLLRHGDDGSWWIAGITVVGAPADLPATSE